MARSPTWNTPHGRILAAMLAARSTTAQQAEQAAGLTPCRLSLTGRRERPDVRTIAEAAEACGADLCIRDRTTGRVYALPASSYPLPVGRDDRHMALMRSRRG